MESCREFFTDPLLHELLLDASTAQKRFIGYRIAQWYRTRCVASCGLCVSRERARVCVCPRAALKRRSNIPPGRMWQKPPRYANKETKWVQVTTPSCLQRKVMESNGMRYP